MQLQDLLHGLPLKEVRCDLSLDISSLTLTSGQAGPGSLFIAKQGMRVHGSAFVHQALAKGAVAVLTDRPCEAPYLCVDDVDVVAKIIAERLYDRSRDRLIHIGITGTMGKTTTAYFLHQLLGDVAGLLTTNEYRVQDTRVDASLTTPDYFTLQHWFHMMVRAGCRYNVMEATSHAIEQNRLEGIAFTVAIFTNFSQDHLDYHKTMEAYFLAKKRLFDALSPEAFAVVNRDDPYTSALVRDCRATILEYGFAPHPFPRYHCYNVEAAKTAYTALGFAPSSEQVAALSLPSGRMERIPNAKGIDLIVDFAHTEVALKSTLEALNPKGRIILVFGCGGDRDRTKRPKMGAVASFADRVFITSDNPRTEDPVAICYEVAAGISGTHWTICPDRREAMRQAIAEAQAGDTVLIAGRGHEKLQIIQNREIPFSDVVVARALVEELCD